jgi:hypothetical protein
LSKVRWLDRELVRSPVYLGLCRSAEELRKEYKRLRIPAGSAAGFLDGGATASVITVTNSDGETACIVCIGDTAGKNPTRVAASLVHEAVHVWQQAKKIIGESDPSDEFEAYAIQSLAERLFDAFVESEQR